MLRIFIDDRFIKTLEIIVSLFGFFMIYQILRSVFGGSWIVENITLSLVILNLGLTFTLGFLYSQLKSDTNHLRNQFFSLASDFKQVAFKVNSLENKVEVISYDLKAVRSDLNKLSRDFRAYIKKN